MQIIAIRPRTGGGNTIAHLDVQMDGLRLFNLALKKTASGYRVFAPSAFGSSVATFTRDIASQIIDAALGEIRQHDECRT